MTRIGRRRSRPAGKLPLSRRALQHRWVDGWDSDCYLGLLPRFLSNLYGGEPNDCHKVR
jgi:hypothetical protein